LGITNKYRTGNVINENIFMSLIINVDTSTEAASICLSNNGEQVLLVENNDQKDHAAWLHVAIDKMMREAGYNINDLQAVAVTSGPGSYTGLRVGMATAKGLCYALNIPLITENTLKVMAFAAKEQGSDSSFLLCPMIDARRMEVFTALYNNNLEELMPPAAIVLDENSFSNQLENCKILFFGNGSTKWQDISKSSHALFAEYTLYAGYLGTLSYKKLIEQQFTDIIYSEPVYTKEFYTHTKK
jgi:tRNA threonylcarbamoyladenosine biosynthesis protein TsaB